MIHGTNSNRLVSAAAQHVLEQMMEVFPWLEEADGIVLDVLCKAKVRYDTLDAYVDEFMCGERANRSGDTGIEAVPEAVWNSLSRAETTIIQAAGKLGLTSTDRAALAKDTSWARALQGDRVRGLANQGQELRKRRTGELPSTTS